METLAVLREAAGILSGFAGLIAIIFAYVLYRERRRSIDDERRIRQEQQRALEEMNDFSTDLIRHTLKLAPQYAFSPLASLSPLANPKDTSLFERRRGHFAPEKEILCEAVADKVCNELLENPQLTIILILDAGSTVFPIFEKLCRNPLLRFNRETAQRLKVITNNLGGVSIVNTYGHVGDKRVGDTLFDCRILAGLAQSEYEASLGEMSEKDLDLAIGEILLPGNNRKSRVVSVTTGNYISIKEGILARDSNHVRVKAKMLELSDDVYVLAPLGKLLPFSRKEINEILRYPRERQYEIPAPWPQEKDNLTIVMTTRKPRYFRQLEPPGLQNHLALVQQETKREFGKSLMRRPFDPMDDRGLRIEASIIGIERALREYEFPHRNLRESLIERSEG